MWEEIETNPKTVREFGFILTGFFVLAPLVVSIIRIFFAHQGFHYRLNWLVLAIAAFLINIFLPQVMTLIYHVAIFITHPISWVMMRVMLGILFYVVLSPVSIIMQLLGKDILDQKINKNAASYWKKHTPRANIEGYERLF